MDCASLTNGYLYLVMVMLDWTWTAKVKKGGPVRQCFAMNISILANGGKGKEINMTPLAEYTSQMFANRDILKGEELMCKFMK